MGLNFSFFKREVFILGKEMQLVVEWTRQEAWITAISRDPISGYPNVIGPMPISTRQIAELLEALAKMRVTLQSNLTHFKRKNPAKATK